MPFFRVILMLVLVTLTVLLVAYFLTQNPQYLIRIKQLLKFTAVLGLFLILFFILGRLIHF